MGIMPVALSGLWIEFIQSDEFFGCRWHGQVDVLCRHASIQSNPIQLN